MVLEDITPEEIGGEEALFGDGLGLDSINALEDAVVLEKRYRIVTSDDSDEDRSHFASVRSLENSLPFVARSKEAVRKQLG